jgi:hypothetical protein
VARLRKQFGDRPAPWPGSGVRDTPVTAGPGRAACGFPAGPEAAVRADVDAWAPSTYTAEGYQGVRQTATYRSDLHVLVEAPDETMTASTIMWLDEVNKSAEFEPVGTHPQLPAAGTRYGDAAAWDAARAQCRSHSDDRRVLGCAWVSAGARAVLRSRVPAIHTGRAADQACGLVSGRLPAADTAPVLRAGRPFRSTRPRLGVG